MRDRIRELEMELQRLQLEGKVKQSTISKSEPEGDEERERLMRVRGTSRRKARGGAVAEDNRTSSVPSFSSIAEGEKAVPVSLSLSMSAATTTVPGGIVHLFIYYYYYLLLSISSFSDFLIAH